VGSLRAIERCPVCGQHPPERRKVDGVAVFMCPKVPPGFVYEHTKFKKGPPGRLIPIGSGKR
jgi:hypothetical protein